MAEIDFADGFDVPEPLAWGMTPAQVGAVLLAAVLAYLTLHSALPRAAAVPLAATELGAGLVVALVRHEGRTLLSWASVAASFWTRPRRGLLVVDGLPVAHAAYQEASIEVEPPRRVRLVLLPEPPQAAPPRDDPMEGGSRPFAIFSAAGGTLLDAPAQRAAPRADGALRIRSVDDVRSLRPARPLRATRRLTFFSLSGGTGRTTLAVEVAGLLATRWRGAGAWGMAGPPQVALVDLDVASPRAGIRLGVPCATDWDLDTAVRAQAAAERLLTVHRTGLRVLPGPARLLPAGSGDRRDLVDGIAAAVGEVESRGCGTVVLDVPGDLSAVTRWALESAHDIFVVLTATAGGVQDAYRSTEALRRLGLRQRLRYVVNRGRGGPALAEAMLDLGGVIVAEIPDDPELERAEMEHRLVGAEGSGATAAALRGLAATVDPQLLAPGRGAELLPARRLLRRRAG